ncbi:DNA repair protein RecO [Neoehrlichia mikurensis]|uniref:DNA repair protein RecO n=1 Tax=Neoehrlichia mikurensis TaxID=89586 RepID=A0A9Q9BYA6_9RICK|nr:DNA repair protein RecO [Neoehrlichia mikurensis]QXK91928.1 DNA repair protein RecO [Neoehrlichia mikurensis]QXK93141.1 DNA repair protein RecO [Neoehrlichia mikurensis]QXK93621.1 DNA repair protein RecO [Neoehrlichia mikurensis]UTO55423.1 DNA repair protein RecO [Neoehrlichia mikurensis]UTO56343.1 DNA repair protein RecO [Neoehrlichia mikurensis]
MRWQDKGIIVGICKYGDQHLIISLLTKQHGLSKGLTRNTIRKVPILQIGDYINVIWAAKSISNLGYFKCELITSTLHYFHDKIKLMCIASITSIIGKILPENEVQPVIYQSLINLIQAIKNNTNWYNKYLKLELNILSHLGFALDLSKCAVNNSNYNLKFISPKTGKAISQEIGLQYKKKLFPLPKILQDIYNNNDTYQCSTEEFKLSLKILGYFLQKNLSINNTTLSIYRNELINQL